MPFAAISQGIALLISLHMLYLAAFTVVTTSFATWTFRPYPRKL